MLPSNNQFHPLFRPVGPEFINVVEERIQSDQENGQKAANTVLQKWIEEIIEDRKIGNGVSSFEKVAKGLDFGTPYRMIVCQACHSRYKYDKDTQNICPTPTCENNPTHYAKTDLGP